MTTIKLETRIAAPIKVCFDLSRSIDLHLHTNRFSNEKAIAGKTSGIIEANESVTWRANHFGLPQQMKVRITQIIKPFFFEDEMVEGPFRSMQHAHIFQLQNGETVMRDEFQYEVPFGWVGKLIDKFMLRRYLLQLLEYRNETIKQVAESGNWINYLNPSL